MKRLIRLTWLDSSGEVYHEADFSPRDAREQLRRRRMIVIDFPGASAGHPLSHVTHASISRSSRGAVAKPHSLDATTQGRVIITLPTD